MKQTKHMKMKPVMSRDESLESKKVSVNQILQPIGEPCQDSLTFFAVSDFGSVNDCVRKLAAAMDRYATSVQAPAFILGLGDNFYPCGVSSVDDPQFQEVWRNVYLRYESLRVPWRIVLGNHDYMGNPEAQVEYTFDCDLNHDGIWQMPARTYSFVTSINQHEQEDSMNHFLAGSNPSARKSNRLSCTASGEGPRVHFYGLDTNGADGEVAAADRSAPAFLHQQIVDLKENLRASDADWKIAFGHHCMYTKGAYHGTTGRRLREETFKWSPRGNNQKGFGLENALIESGVHAYFCGHEHVFQHMERKGLHHFMCGASGAERRGSKGVLGAANLEIDWIADGNEFGFVVCTVTSQAMTVRFVNDKLQLLKEVVIPRRDAESIDSSQKVAAFEES